MKIYKFIFVVVCSAFSLNIYAEDKNPETDKKCEAKASDVKDTPEKAAGLFIRIGWY